MSRRFALAAAVVALAVLVASAALAASPPRLFRQPTLSATSIVFSFAGDLWSVPRAGGEARRLTASPGVERDPVFSPDGSTLAFTGEYDGNVDVYTMPADGGPPKRLTWHPDDDRAVGWTNDGTRVVFRSARDTGNGDARLWTIPAAGGWPERLPLPEGYQGTFSPDGRRLAYQPFERTQMAWKRYRGGETTFVWLLDLATLDLEAVPRDNSNDSWPCWASDGRVYFLSDRDGPVELWRYDPATRAVARAFANDGFDLKNARPGPGAIVFERFGQIGLYDLATGAVTWPPITVTSDLEETRPRWVKVGDQLTSPALSPTGARAAFSARGEILTVPAEKGDFRDLSRSPGAADRDPTWSPDGQTLAWLSDATGEYALVLAPQSGIGARRTIPLGDPPSFFYRPLFSPDGKKIALTDKRLNLWIVDVASGAMTRVDTDTYDHPERSLDPAWSPDSRYLAYTKRLASQVHALFLYELAAGRAHQITDGLADVRFPAFDAGGKYLWFTASTDFGPSSAWLDLTSVERPVSRSVWLAVLAAKEASPFGPQSDEEPGPDATGGDGARAARPAAVEPEEGKQSAGGKKRHPHKKSARSEEESATGGVHVKIDFDGLEHRLVAVPGIEARNFQSLAVGRPGEVFLLESPQVLDADAEDGGTGPLWRYSLTAREATEIADDVARVEVSRDGSRLLLSRDDTWAIVDVPEEGDEIEEGAGELALDDVQVRVEPLAEWRQMYHEVWRIERDFLYDPGYHGLDLAAAERRYAPYVAGIAHRDDLNYLFTEMLGELTLGHVFVGGGDRPEVPEVKGGLLGADWEIANGRYRIARVYSGETWNPKLPAPLARPGVDARAGEYLIAVEGREVRPPASLYSSFEATAGRSVRLRLAADPEGRDGRDVDVVPVESERRLRYRAWAEDNRRTVAERSGGRLGYVHLPDTGGAGYEEFNRYFFAESDREGLIVDERDNGGGLVADYVVEILGRKLLWGVATREGRDLLSPAGAVYGPKVMLINRHAGSGGDALPWMFRELGLGPLVGTRTWGGLVGIWDYPELLDGGQVTAPRGGLYTQHGKWEVENHGVAPDVEVEVTPADFVAGRDPQLARAVAVVLAELAKSPPQRPARPPFPNYQTTPWRSEAEP
jgi:tricorn protease